MKRSMIFLALSATIAATPAWALSVKTTMARAELVIPGIAPEQSIEAVHDAMSGWFGSPPISQRPLPDPLPARPGKPGEKQVPLGPVYATTLDCSSATAEITKEGSANKTKMSFNQDVFQACIYPFEKGVKVYMQAINIDAADSTITSGLFSGIAKGIRGTPGEALTKRLNDMIGKLREKVPKVLVERMEAPGMPTQQPDLAEVQALIPPEPEKSVAAVTLAAVPSVATAPATGSPAVMIEARKSLHAMGMTYHSQEQFHDAIRRKDELAVKLFLEAGGVDPAAKDAQGRNATDLAREIGAANVARLLDVNAQAAPATDKPLAVTALPTQEEQVQRMRELIRQQMRRQMQ